MEEQSKRTIIRLAAAVVAGGVMLSLASYLGSVGTDPASLNATEMVADTSAVQPTRHHIAQGERLFLDSAELSEAASLHVTLEFPDVWRGETPRPVRVVSGDGRAIDVIAAREIDGEQLFALEIDSSALTPGPYLIEIKSAERSPLQLRRFVFEVR